MANIIRVDFKKKKRIASFPESYEEALRRGQKKELSELIDRIRDKIKSLSKSPRRFAHYERFIKALKEEVLNE